MTLRAAEEAAGVTITAVPGPAGASCAEAHISGLDMVLVVIVESATALGADPMDGIVRAVSGSVLPTEEGAMVGQTRAELIAVLGEPTRTESQAETYGPDAELLVFESGGYAYGALVFGDLVTGLASGDPTWVGYHDGCEG
jgi:hypothetical protein